MASFIVGMILLTMFFPATSNPKPNQNTTTAAEKEDSSAFPTASVIQQCNVSIKDVEVKSLEFSKLLLQKMTQFVVVSIEKESSEGQSAPAPYSKMVWINNAVGMTIFPIIRRRPEIFSDFASLGTLTAGRRSFEININEDPEGCSKINETKETETLQDMTAILGKKAIINNEVHCQLTTWNEDRIHVCCRRNTSASKDNCLSSKAFEFLEGNHALDYVIVIFCYILCPIALARASAFLENEAGEHLKVPQNFILRKILGKVCYKSRVPKIVFLIFFIWWAILKNFEDEAWLPILVTSFIFVVLLLSDFHRNFESEVDTYPFERKFLERFDPCLRSLGAYIWGLMCLPWDCFVKVHNTIFQPYPGFSYSDTNIQINCSWSYLGFCGRVFGTFVIIFGVVLPPLFFIRILKYILLGLLLNHDHYLPTIALCVIAAFYITKCIQSACESYSSLLINLFNYLETQEAVNENCKYENGNFLIRTDAYEKVRQDVMPYGQTIFYLVVKVIFIILFFVVVFKGLNYAQENTEFSIYTKVVSLFALSTLPLILKICFWEQSDEEKEILVKTQSKEIKNILENIGGTLQENQKK